jgi:hypothetical protein
MGDQLSRRYLVERYVPGITRAELRATERGLADAVAAVHAGGTPLVYLGSTFIPEEESCFIHFEGVLEGVKRACLLAGMDFARIVEVEEVAP